MRRDGVFGPAFDRRVLFQKSRAEQRDYGHRYYERRQQREREGQRQSGEEELTHAVEEHYREEIHDVHQRSRQHGQAHFRATHFRCDARQRAHFQVPVDVLQRDYRVIDHPREGQRHPAQDHGIHRAAHQGQHHECRHGRERNRKQYSRGGPHTPQEDQDHDAGQDQSDGAFMQHRLQGRFHIYRLIEHYLGD